MPTSQTTILLCQWGERFQNDRLAAGVVTELRDQADEIWRHAFTLLQRESPEYRNSVDDEFTMESKAHCNELLTTIISIVAGRAEKSGVDAFDFVRTHAAWRARHQVPLVASLHAYRLAHRTYWEITKESVLRHRKQDEAILSLTMLSDFWIELFDHVGSVLEEAHAVEEGLIVARSTRSYVRLIDDLLGGIQPQDAESQRLCKLCGIRPGAPMAVAVARPLNAANGGHIDHEISLRAFVRLIEQVLPPAVFGKLIDIRNGEVRAIICGEADTARGFLQALRRGGFARRSRNGQASTVGLSLDAVEATRLPQALEEARLAFQFTTAAQPIMHFSDIDLPELLVRQADQTAIRLIPEWVRHFNSNEDDSLRQLAKTIRVFADCSFNVKRTAQRLNVHTNTVYFRLKRIKELTKINPRTYSGTSFLLTALRLLEVHGGPGA
jgi:PucR C-terminal helix-turn-helix domain